MEDKDQITELERAYWLGERMGISRVVEVTQGLAIDLLKHYRWAFRISFACNVLFVAYEFFVRYLGGF
jgi:hypothetical protein